VLACALRLLPFALALLLTACSAASFLKYRVLPDHPDGKSDIRRLEGLGAPVRVLFDAQGVPHLDAQSEEDLLRATGYVHARMRFFQMDMLRRFASGRISELVGRQPLMNGTTVDFDQGMRGWGLEALAASGVEAMDPEERRRLRIYVAGANQALKVQRPVEYRLLGVSPEPWREEDTLVIGLLNAWSVSHNWQQEVTRLLLAMSVGLDRSEAIYPSRAMGGGRTLPPQTEQERTLPPGIAPELADLFPAQPPPSGSLASARVHVDDLLLFSGASNAWAVDGRRSRSGAPLLAADPHLSHFLPSLVFQQHQRAPGLDVIGMTIPGLPYVLVGHNQKVAWGITSTVADAIDLVLERPLADDPDQVESEGRPCALESRVEQILVRDGAALRPHPVTFRRTCNGPLLNDARPDLLGAKAPLVAIRWHLDGLESSLAALREVNRASSVEGLGAAVQHLLLPVSTWTAADVDGRIGVFVSGTVPVRPNHLGTFPVPGWSARYQWQQFLLPEQMPKAMDPPAGYLAHANNLMVEPSRALHGPVHVDSAPSFRFDRIVELLEAAPLHDGESMARMQTDVRLKRAEHLLPAMRADLEGLTGLEAAAAQARELLLGWDLEATSGSPGALLFWSTYRHAVLLAMADELDSGPLRFFMSQRYSTNVADLWFDDVAHPVWDDRRTPAVEDRQTVMRGAFVSAVRELQTRHGADPTKWRWGEAHFHKPQHLFGKRSMLDGTFNLPRSEIPGGLDSVWKAHFDPGDPHEPFRLVAGPVYRMVIDLAEPARGAWVVDTGASGWPGAPHYGDQYEVWKRGGLVPMISDWKELARAPSATLTLQP
jgi:penicillin G amidase